MRSANWKAALCRKAILPLLTLLCACTQGRSYIVVTLRALNDSIPGVAQVRLQLSASGMADDLTYGSKPGPMLELTAVTDTTLSVSFSDSFVGKAMLSATVLDVAGNVLGYGENPAVQIAAGRIAYAVVLVKKGASPPAPTDGGVDDGGSDGGPDSALLMCAVGDVNACGANSTCGLSCLGDKPTSKCLPAGSGKHGEACTDLGQCAPGTQCTVEPCGAKLCKQLCRTNQDCPANTVCFAEQVCGNKGSGLKTCSHVCDPTGSATVGCAQGLRCMLFADEVTNCECVDPQQFGTDGVPCTTSANCAPGNHCVMSEGKLACRPICRLSSPSPCGLGSECTALVNPTLKVFGACLSK